MATKSLGSLTVDMVLQTAGFEQGFDRAERIADQKTRQIERHARERAKAIETAFGDMARTIAGPLAAAMGAGTFTAMVTNLANAGDQMQKLSTKTGLTVENLSKLQYAGSLADVSTEDLGASLTKLNRVMGDAANGSKSATEALKRFDIKPGTNALAAFQQIADKVKATGDETKIASGLNDVFGKSYATLIPLLKGGSEAIKETGDELERMGGVMTSELAASSEAFNDNITRLNKQLEILRMQTIGPLIPLFLEVSNTLTQTAEKSDTLSASGATLKAVFETVAVVGFNTAYVFRGIGTELGGIAAQLNALAHGDFDAFSYIGEAMKEDAEKARKDIDALSERLLNPPKITVTTPTVETRGSGGIADTPPPKTTNVAKAISEGQRLVDQLRERLLSTQELTEVEKLQAQFATARYSKLTSGEKDVALGIAAQIDARKVLQTELDAELATVKELTAEYAAQESRLMQLVSNTDIGKTLQRMQDEALAEGAFISGKIDRSTYDQIIESLNEVKDAGDETFKGLQEAIEGWGKESADAFVEFAFTGKTSFADMTTSILKDIAKMMVYQNVTKPAASWLGGLATSIIGGMFGGQSDSIKLADGTTFSAKGNVFTSPSLHQYANTVQTTPKFFEFAKGGVFAEAGPEAVMPLARDSQGRLGVRSQDSGGAIVNTRSTTTARLRRTAPATPPARGPRSPTA